MTRRKNALLAALVVGALTSVSAVSVAQADDTTPTHADKKAAKKQAEADKDAAVAQAKADKKKTESQSEANEAAADAKLKDAKKAD
ncbi:MULTISPECIES: hypothetical protein [unclassified Caballeronia]|uniref:hypothetical protein n=1 Tax=unclassified Caballeronia TaxID=2646786 RepID=UPI00285C5C4B|nr:MULTISPECIES: hypothetical protein [unclassified Caballeronia]MDR5737831.1 hypothetical protein [Caballeronia sp. LZ016]MDR5809633.1 hypothetical protein [Caballeronia sp. LZ019]